MGEQQQVHVPQQMKKGLSENAKAMGVTYGFVGLGLGALGSAMGSHFYPNINAMPPAQKAALIGTAGVLGYIIGVGKSDR